MHKADILEISYKTCEEESKFEDKYQEYKVDFVNKYGYGASGWIYIIKLKLLKENNISWNEELSYGEDYLFAFQIKETNHKNIFTKNYIYNYRKRSTSAMNNKSSDYIKKHINDMIKLAEIYESELKKDYNKKTKHNLIARKGLCIQEVLIDIILNNLEEVFITEILTRIEKNGLYPYKSLYFKLKYNGNIKNTLFSYTCFLLNKKWYLNLILSLKKIIRSGKFKKESKNENFTNKCS